MKWILIRHGQTRGNTEGRYIGRRTDEPLCEAGIQALQSRRYPPVCKVYASPMKRCLETARLIYPGVPVEIVEDFQECDFGDFENKNHAELNGTAAYQRWIDSNGTLPFPNGESRRSFSERCVKAFKKLEAAEDCAIVAHGGTIMAIMEASTGGDYFDFQLKNGEGYRLYENGSYEILFEKTIDTKKTSAYNEHDK